MSHKCHLPGCDREVHPNYLMCRAHWLQVPFRLKRAVLVHHRLGQEVDKQPSAAYLNAARAAIDAVAQKEER